MWLVKLEFAPTDGAQERSGEDLMEIAAAVQQRFAPQRVLAHGGGDRFVVFAQVRSSNERSAESWAREVLYEAVVDFLPDWRLELLEV
jgi:hypothetical protein